MIRHAILSVLVLSAAFVSAAGKFPDSVTDGSGVNIHFTDAKAGELEMLKAAGFKHIRMDFTWGSTEREKGVYDFSAYDRLTASLEKHGLTGYYILDYANGLYEKERSVRTPEGRAAYAKWAAAAVGHFKGKGICWEIWNEPNGGFWSPIANVAEYTAMAVEASKAIRAADPDAILTGPATSTIDMPFLEGCFKAGLLEWWDAVSVHPYRQTGPESVDVEYHALRKLIGKYAPAGRSIPILSGEWGYSSAWMNHDDESQGKMLPRQWLVNAANGVPISIWYDWHDDGPDPKEAEHHFGTVELKYHEGRTPVYDPKPAYHAAKTFNTQLAGKKFIKRLSLGNGDHHAVLFGNKIGSVLGVWTISAGERPVRLPSDDGEFLVTNHLGETLPSLQAKNGWLEFTVDDSPKYLSFRGGNEKLAAAPEALRVKMAIIPCLETELVVRVENLSGQAMKAKIIVDRAEGLVISESAKEIAIPADEAVSQAVFRLKEAPQGAYEVGARMEVDGVVVSEISPRRFSAPDPIVLQGARAVGEGDPKIGGTFTLSQADDPATFPGGAAAVMKLDYVFEPGWKYAPIYPGTFGKEIEGRPATKHGRALFGMWIYGDSSQLTPRLRVTDAGGRTWQPFGPDIRWQGWKYVELKLDESTAHWGGADDQQKRGPEFPLTWQAPFLLDNTSRLAAKGTVYFTMPVVILE